jgi:hypothetical protein
MTTYYECGGWQYRLVAVIKVKPSEVGAYGGPGFDSGWNPTGDDVQYRTVVSLKPIDNSAECVIIDPCA